MDGHNNEKDEQCRKILFENNFLIDEIISDNEYWINPNYFRKELFQDTLKEKK